MPFIDYLESDVLTLMLTLVVTGLTLAVFFYVGAMFFQGYIYTEPSQELYWQAPAAGGVLMAFLMLWCVLIVNAEGASTRDIPYDTLFRFSPRVDLLKDAAQEIWAVNTDGEKRPYKRKKEVTGLGLTSDRYVDAKYTPSKPWRNDGVEGVELVIDGENYFFKLVKPDKGSDGKRVERSDGAYDEFVNDKGWVMKAYEDGPDGTPSIFRWGRFLMNIFLNFGHFLLWWLCLWLILRFQWSHALGLGFALWLMFTLIVLPMLLNYAAEVAQSKAATGQVRLVEPNPVANAPGSP